MQNAVIYARYSSHGQNEQSIDGQIEECKAYCDSLNLDVVKVYADRAISGKQSENRLEFQEMIADSKKGVFDYIVVWKLDRFARNRYDSAIYKRELSKRGIRVLSAKQQISLTDEGIFYEAMLEANDEYYSRNLSTNVRRGQRQTVDKGLFPGGKVPFGYKVERTPIGNRLESRVVIDPLTAPIIQYIYEEYAKGTPKKQIINDLNKKGYKSYTGQPFTFNSFQNALTNEKYTGEFYYGKDKQFNNSIFPQIIDKGLFEKVQQRLKTNKHQPARAKAKVQYLLTGKAFCGHCGAPIIGTSAINAQQNKFCYYNCSNQYRHHDCNKKAEKKVQLEEIVTKLTIEYVLNPKRISFVADKLIEAHKKSTSSKEIQSIESQITNIEIKINNAAESFIDAKSSATREVLDKQIENLTFLKEELTKQLIKTKALHNADLTKSDIVAELKRFCTQEYTDFDFQKLVIEHLVRSVYVYDDKIVVYYNISGTEGITFENMQEQVAKIKEDGVKPPSSPVRILNQMPCQCTSNTNSFYTDNVYYIFVSEVFGLVLLRK